MSYIDIVEHKNEILCWQRTDSGELEFTRSPLSDYLYCFMKDNSGKGQYKDIYGHQMKKVSFSDKKKLTEFAASRSDIVAESDVKPVYHYILDHFLDANTNAPYNLSFFDIEVDFDLQEGKGYPSPKNPFGEINAISVFDVSMQCYIMFIPSHLKGTVSLSDERDGYDVEIVWCRSERDMLKKWSEYLEHVDILSAWNGQAFDISYIMERLIINFGEKKALTMMTRDGVPARRRDFTNEYKEDVWEWTLPGRIHLDMMLLFKKFHPGEKKSFKLDSICEEVLGEKKIEYEDDLGSLYRQDPQKFFEYSLHDSRLLKMLDDEQKVINLAMLMVWDMCALPKDVTGSVNIINMALMKFCRKKNNIVLPDIQDMEKEEFEGALVYDTIQGKHDWIFTIDLGALYPSAIMLIGMSKENLLFQAKEGYLDYIRIMTKSDEEIQLWDEVEQEWITAFAYEVESLIRENGLCISGNATIFDGSMGLLAQFTQEGFDQRTHYKKMMKDTNDEKLYGLYNLYQQVMKIRNNSIYGVLSQPVFRMADIRISASTTATGRLISKWQAYKANELVEMMRGDM